MPWYFPLAFNPLSSFLPWDRALENSVALPGAELFKRYQAEATRYWQSHRSGPHFSTELAGSKLLFTSVGTLSNKGDRATITFTDANVTRIQALEFDPQTGCPATHSTAASNVSPEVPKPASVAFRLLGSRAWVGSVPKILPESGLSTDEIFLLEEHASFEARRTLYASAGQISNLWQEQNHIYWLEYVGETARVCRISKSDKMDEPTCVVSVRMPQSLALLGERTRDELTQELIFGLSEQTLLGDRHRIFALDLVRGTQRELTYELGGRPLAYAEAGGGIFLLVAHRQRRVIHEISSDGACRADLHLEDTPVRMVGLADGSLVLGLYGGDARGPQNKSGSTHSRRLPRSINPPIPASGCNASSGVWPTYQPQTRIGRRHPLRARALPLLRRCSRRHPSRKSKAKTRPQSAMPLGRQDRSWLSLDWCRRRLGLSGWLDLDSLDGSPTKRNRASDVSLRCQSRYPNSDLSFTTTRYWPTLQASLFHTPSFGMAVFIHFRKSAVALPMRMKKACTCKRGFLVWRRKNTRT